MAVRELPIPKIDALPLGAHRVFMLTDEALWAQTGVRVAFTSRDGGVSEGPYASLNTGSFVGDDLTHVERNRELAQEALGFAGAPLVMPNQVHGTHVVVVNGEEDVPRAQAEADEGADAVVGAGSGVSVLMNFADCLPVIMASPTGRFVVAHAGWRGAIAGIAGIAARAFADVDAKAGESVPTSSFNAYIGPHICEKCFEVSVEVATQFADTFGEEVLWDDRHVSLARAVAVDLQRAGLLAERIVDCKQCTKCNPEKYFSYRAANGDCGRQAAIAYKQKIITGDSPQS